MPQAPERIPEFPKIKVCVEKVHRICPSPARHQEPRAPALQRYGYTPDSNKNNHPEYGIYMTAAKLFAVSRILM
jgi:hypothetical protein